MRSEAGMFIEQEGILMLYNEIQSLDPIIKENIVTLLKFPEVLDNALWLSNTRNLLINMEAIRRFEIHNSNANQSQNSDREIKDRLNDLLKVKSEQEK